MPSDTHEVYAVLVKQHEVCTVGTFRSVQHSFRSPAGGLFARPNAVHCRLLDTNKK